ncbi:hypothetical protein GCM10022408_01460 [Hymenobacter fastidiosus]|uniref:Uncharacterized protein n=1 Tax=Hymenobacter fastidiosus TaxID=486264 RepID=A0ABP7RAX3_9BACT
MKRTLGPADGQTRFTPEGWFTGRSKPPFGRVSGKRYRALLPGMLATTKARAIEANGVATVDGELPGAQPG